MRLLRIECVDRGGPVVVWLEEPDGASKKLATVHPTHPQELTVEVPECGDDGGIDVSGDPYTGNDARFEPAPDDEEEADE